MHGDFGRTTPNLSTLMEVECDILQLDVEVTITNWNVISVSTILSPLSVYTVSVTLTWRRKNVP